MAIPTPPPVPGSMLPKSSAAMGYGTKLVLISLTGILLMIASFVVWGFTSSRETTSNATAQEIARSWGGPVEIGEVELLCDSLAIVPETYRCAVQVESQTLHRSIYEAQVYNAQIRASGKMANDSSSVSNCRFRLEVVPSSVVSIEPLLVGDHKYVWTQTATGFEAELNSFPDAPFQIDLTVKGSRGLTISECGHENYISINGNCTNPSFGSVVEYIYEKEEYDGINSYPLPNDRDVTKEHFSATWSNTNPMTQTLYANVSFLVGVDRYQKVERSLKYAFLIILFAFLSVFFAERITRYPIPVLNYLLIGLALILFYVLLLSLCEQMAFGAAYTIASALTVCLISAYMWGMLHSTKVAGAILAILTAMYASCYVLLCLSTYALIMGSLMMFCALAVSMYASLKIRF